MSTFCGYFKDLKYISVDMFEGNKNLESKVYFLSHCHSDHMRGLSSKYFQDRLLNNSAIYLYASPVSIRILTGLYPALQHKFKTVPLKESILIEIPQNDGGFLTVTSIPAGHCPGSVMFLFESNKNILYTGDIRLNATDLEKYRTVFHISNNIKKRIDLMYLDTTFFSPTYMSFPERSESLKQLVRLVADWIAEGPNYVINLITSAKYGHEYLFSELNHAVGMPIHVNEEIFDFYKHIPDMDNITTLKGDKTRIHASCAGYTKICLESPQEKEISPLPPMQYNVRSIKTCAMSFFNFKENNEICKKIKNTEFYRLCYSCHSSYEELVDFISFFEPVEIKASVIPKLDKDKEKLYSYIKTVLSKLNISVNSGNSRNCEDVLFDIENKARNKIVETEEDLDFLLDSPPPSAKRSRFI